jgi:hypothetical protein
MLRMRARKRVLDLVQRAESKISDRLRPWAFPGHGVALPPVLLFALQKSGSIFIQRALRRTLQVEVNHISGAGTGGGWLSYPELCRFAKGNAVTREHMQPRAELPAVLAQFNIRRAVVHVRDPRAAIISWTRHMDRNLPARGLSYVAFSCEQEVPGSYLQWSFEQRLQWQVEHVMPRMVAWIEGWLEIADRSKSVTFLVTDYAELARDNRAYILKLLDFFEVPYQPDWVKIPRREFGRNNIFSLQEPGALPPQPIAAGILASANAGTPQALIDRFGWTQATA